MPFISAKFTADISDFKTKVQQATAEVTNFKTSTAAVGRDLARFGADFSGATTIRQFQSMVAAVNEVGGASRLTVSEVGRLGATAVEVLAKYQALGQEAPADIRRVADEAIKLKAANEAAAKSASDIGKATKAAGDSSSPLSGIFGKIGGAVAGAFSIGAIVNFGSAVVDTVSQIHDMAEETGLSTDAVQELKYAATQTGTSLETVTGAIGKMAKGLDEGTTKTRQAVKDLGLSFDQLQQESPDQAFSDIVAALQQVPDPMKQMQLALELFGKSGGKILPAVKEGFADLRKEAHETGQVISQEAVKSIEALGDAWGRVKTNVAVGAGGLITDLIKAHDALAALVPGGGGKASTTPDPYNIASMGQANRKDAAEAERVQAALTAAKRTADISLGSGSNTDLVAQLQAAKNAIAQFTPEMRAAAAAGEAMGLSNEKIAQSVSKVQGGFEVTTQDIELYTKVQKEAIKLSPEKAFGDAAQKADELAVFIQKAGGATTFSRDKQAEFNKTLLEGAEAHRALHTAASPVYDLVLKEAFATAHWSDVLKLSKNNVEDLVKAVSNASVALVDHAAKTDITIGAYAKLDLTADQASKTIRSIGDKGISADQAYISSLDKVTQAYRSFGLVSQQELQRAAISATQNYGIVLASGTATTAQLGIAYEQMIYAQVLATGKIPTLWQTIAHDIPALMGTIADSFADNLGKMVTGQESFKDGFLAIWHDIQKGLGNIFADLVSQFERTFISNITSALLGGSSAWGGIIATAISGGAQAGVANAAVGSAVQGGTGIGTQAAVGGAGIAGGAGVSTAGLLAAGSALAGPVAGAIVGWKVGRATGSVTKGALSGAATGAAVGSVVPGGGTIVGAAVGAIAGAWGAHRANEDARNDMVAIRAELEKTFGSLDNVRTQAASVGVNIDTAFADIGRGVKGVAEFNKIVGEFETKWNALDGAMKRYGLTTTDITNASKSAGQLFSENTARIQSDFTALTGAGLGKDTVITKMADSFNDLLIAAKDSGSKIPAELEPILDRMAELGLISDDTKNKLLGIGSAGSGDLQKAAEIAQKYGITLAQLGPSFQQSDISARAKDIYTDFLALKDLNVDIGGSLAGMSDEISQFVVDAKKAGAEVPENMRPILEELVANGQLIDENGDKLHDLTGIKFGQPMADQFAPVTDAIHELIAVLTGKDPKGLPGALQAGIDQMAVIASKAQIRIPVGFDIPNLPDNFPDGYPNTRSTPPGERPMATGGIVFGPTHALVGEAGAELVAPLKDLPKLLPAAASNSRPIEVTTVIQMDTATVARKLFRVWPQELRTYGLAR